MDVSNTAHRHHEGVPITTPDRITVPDVWDEPVTGTEWCGCGGNLDADRIHN